MNQANKQEAKVALVTGGARRIGAAIVRQVHQAGYKVLIHCRTSLSEAHALATDLNQQRMNSAFVLQRDLTQPDAALEIMEAVMDWAGRLDLLVNNASVFMRSSGSVFDAHVWQLLFDTNVKAPFSLSLAAQPLLAKHEGAIINITDIHAQKPLKAYAAYCQSKAAFEMQTKALAREFAPAVRVNAVAPGAIAWPEDANALSPQEQQKIIAGTLLKRHGEPEYIAQAVLALAEHPFITGQSLAVDGGRSLK